MNSAVSLMARYARDAWHVALWAGAMAAEHPEASEFYRAMRRRQRKASRDFMRSARSLKRRLAA